MGAISGRGGLAAKTAASIAGIDNWTLRSLKADLQAVVTSATKGATVHVIGNLDWSGQYKAPGHTPFCLPGDSFTFKGSFDGVKGCSGPALCTEAEIVWDIEGGKVIEHTVSFEANGALAVGAEAAVADTSIPNPPSSKPCILKLTPVETASPVEVTVDELRTMRLRLRRPRNAYVASGLPGQTRGVTGNLSAEASFSVYHDDIAGLVQPNDIREAKLYVDATLFWHLKWLRFGELSDIVADVATGNPVGATLNAMHTAVANVGAAPGTPTVGWIKRPDTTTFWN